MGDDARRRAKRAEWVWEFRGDFISVDRNGPFVFPMLGGAGSSSSPAVGIILSSFIPFCIIFSLLKFTRSMYAKTGRIEDERLDAV